MGCGLYIVNILSFSAALSKNAEISAGRKVIERWTHEHNVLAQEAQESQDMLAYSLEHRPVILKTA